VQLSNNGAIHLFPPLIYKFEYEFDQSYLKPKIDDLFSLVEINSDLEKGAAISTVSLDQRLQPHTWPELEHFQHWLGEKIANIREEHQFYNGYSEVQRSWCNRHLRSGYTLEHNHTFATWVASCYFMAPAGSGNIEFLDPLEYHKSNFPVVPEVSFYKEVQVATNNVLIFPGWIKHRVQPNNTDQERVVITFNIK